MTFLTLSSILGLCLAPQASPQPVNGGTTSGSASKSGASQGLADVLTRMQSRSGGHAGGGGRFSPPGGTNVQVNSPSNATQFGPSIAVDPTDRLHLIASASDYRNATSQSAFFASFDGGLSWSELFDAAAYVPAVAFGAAGEVYFASSRFFSSFPNTWTDIVVGRSYDGGLTVPNWVRVTFGGAHNYNGSPNLAVDRTGGTYAGNAYLVYTNDSGEGSSGVIAARSSDGGQTWSSSAVSDCCGWFFYPTAAVDSNGVLHVVFYDYNAKRIFTDSSPDGGVTWGTDVGVAGASEFDIPNFERAVVPAAKIAVDTSGGPHDGKLYVVWTKGRALGGPPDVVLSTSTDGGATWSTPIIASDVVLRSQYAPSIDVDANGNVNIGFYDARDDLNNRRVHYYLSRSSDGGQSIEPNFKASDVDFDPSSYADGRQILQLNAGIASSDQTVHAIWTDGRNGDNDIYTAAVDLDFYTDVSVLSAATGGTVTFTVHAGPLFQNDDYWVVGSASGTTPGTDLFFVHLPLNYDDFTLWTLLLANSSSLPGFTGALDATGAAAASLVSGPLPPALVGYQMDFAALVEVGAAFRWASAATHLEIGN